MTQQAVLVLAHGSRDAGARAEYARLTELLVERLPKVPVEFCVLEFPGDGISSIQEAVERFGRAGIERIVAVPYFLFAAGHVRDDLPRELRAAAAEYSGLRLAYQPPIGVNLQILGVLESRAREAAAALAPGEGPTALLLVGAGTSHPESNADLYRAARLLWERRRFELVEVGFVSLTQPALPEAVDRCWALGARRVVVTPYFLNTGVLSRRIASRFDALRQQHPGLELALAAELGLHPGILDLLAERARIGLGSSSDGLALPPCAERGGAWQCWLELGRQPAPEPGP